MINKDIYPLVSDAIRQNDIEKVIDMVSSDNEILTMMTPFGTWLHFSAARGKLDIVKKLVELGLDLNTKGGTFKGTALNEAATQGHFEIVKYLLSCGAELDVSGSVQNPLFGAILKGHLNIVKLLIENGIDFKVKYTTENLKNTDALGFARLRGQTEIANYLESLMEEKNENKSVYQDSKNELLDFINLNYGEISNSIGEIIPGSNISITVHIIPPSSERNYTTLITTGMSDKPLKLTSKESIPKYSELLIKLPPDWFLNEVDMRDPNKNWSLIWLRQIAHMTHVNNTSIGDGLIIPNGEPSQPFADNTKLSSILVSSLISETNDVSKSIFKTSKGNVINFYTLIPIYEEEQNLAYTNGFWELIDLFLACRYNGIIDLKRENFALKYK